MLGKFGVPEERVLSMNEFEIVGFLDAAKMLSGFGKPKGTQVPGTKTTTHISMRKKRDGK